MFGTNKHSWFMMRPDQSLNRAAFTLIEVMVAVALIAIMAAIIVPNLQPRDPKYARQQFIGQLNSLCRLAVHNAVVTNKTHKLFFDLEKGSVRIEVETDKRDTQGETIFQPARDAYVHKTIKWPKNFEVKNFYIEGYDEMARYSGRSTGQMWFFVVPTGMTQAVTINVVDTKDALGNTGKYRSFSIVLNPFSAQFKEYDTFQKP